MGTQLVGGVSVAFHTCCGIVVQDTLLKDQVALHVTVGNSAKNGGITNSISGEFEALHALFRSANASLNAMDVPVASLLPIISALKREIPVVVAVNEADAIGAVVRLQQEFGFELVLLGAAEAHLLADTLASTSPPVSVMWRARAAPSNFDTSRSRVDALTILANSGVKAGIYIGDPDNARNLRWEAGFAVQNGLSFQQALASITRNVAEILHLDVLQNGVGIIEVGQRANFLAFDDLDVLSLRSRVQVVALGTQIECKPVQK